MTFASYVNGMPASQEAAPYLGRAVELERKSQDDVVRYMVQHGCHMPAEEITRVLDFTGVHVMDRMAEEGCAVEGWIPGLGRSPGRGHGHPLWYSCLENPHGQRSQIGRAHV